MNNVCFFGGVTASMSHDLRNVLATINEYAGLLEDLQAAADRGRPLSPDQLRDICQRISSQVDRGQQVLGLLSRFSHLVDEPGAVEFAPGRLLEDAVQYCQRSARLKRVQLELSLGERDVRIVTDRFALLRVICNCIELSLASATEERCVFVSFEATETGCEIGVESADGLAFGVQYRSLSADLRQDVEALGGTLRWEKSEEKGRMILVLDEERL